MVLDIPDQNCQKGENGEKRQESEKQH